MDKIVAVRTANDESDALNELDLRRQAVYDETFEANSNIPTILPTETGDYISLIAYNPKKLEYHAKVSGERMAVFSEIYYPYGWKATIDGQPADLYRVNYMLRALVVPEGEHDIVMFFAPDSIRKGNMLALSCFAVFLLTLIGSLVFYFRSKRKAV